MQIKYTILSPLNAIVQIPTLESMEFALNAQETLLSILRLNLVIAQKVTDKMLKVTVLLAVESIKF